MRVAMWVAAAGAAAVAMGCGGRQRDAQYGQVVLDPVRVVETDEVELVDVEPVPQEVIVVRMDDDDVEDAVEDALERANIDISDMRVNVEGGDVTLKGEAKTWNDRERAPVIASQVPGVQRVFYNELGVD